MALVNKSKREINAKLVYYGPGLSGKTTNLNHIYNKLKPEFRGKLKSMNVQGDKMFFFDFTPPGDGNVHGYNVRLHIYTLRGEPAGPAPWKMVLKGVDGIVFVADSSPERMAANRQSLQNLDEYLQGHDQAIEDIPLVFAYNKRDRNDALTVEEMQRVLNPRNSPSVPVTAGKGDGVLNALLALVKMVLKNLREGGVDLGDSAELQGIASQPENEPGGGERKTVAADNDEYIMGSTDEDFTAEPQAVTLTEVNDGEPEISFLGGAEMVAPGHLRLPLMVKWAGKETTISLNLSLN